MSLPLRVWVLALVLAGSVASGRALAAGEGQKDLDKATEAKLTATTMSDLGEVIRLCESALTKGLDEDGAKFARQLLSATRIQRGMVIAKSIFGSMPPDPNWAQFRRVALDDLEKGVELDPQQPDVLLMIARLNLLPGGDAKRAAQALDEAIQRSQDDRAAKARALTLRAGLEEDPKKKLSLLDQAVEADPNDGAALRTRGSLYADQQKYDQALADLKKAAEMEPESALTHEAIASVLIEMKRFDEALTELDRLAELAPKSAIPLVQKARVYALQSKNDEAMKTLDRAYALEPGNVAVLLMRASVYQELKQTDKALADVDQALKLRPGLPLAMRLRASLLAGSGKKDIAIGELEELQRAEPEDEETTLYLAFFYNAEKMHRKAIEKFDEVLKRDADNAAALRGRGDSLLGIGKHAEAIADYEKALKLEPDDAGVLNNLAWVLATSPKDEVRNGNRAIELATKACKATDYKAPHILSTLGAAYAETGDFENAKKWSQQAIELSEGEEKETLKKELDSYLQQKPVRELMNEDKSDEAGKPKADDQTAKKPSDDQAGVEKPGAEEPKSEKPKTERPKRKAKQRKAPDAE